MQAYYAVFRHLAGNEQDEVRKWGGAVEREGEVDELGRRVGREVVINLRQDGGIGRSGMRQLLRMMLENLAEFEEGRAGQREIRCYLDACYASQRQGTVVKLDNVYLWHVLTEGALLNALNSLYGEPQNEKGAAWQDFADHIDSCRVEEACLLLDGTDLNFKGHQVFAALEEDTLAWGKPVEWDAVTACAALGLSKDWTGYGRGDRLWLVSYVANAALMCRVPTVADADWRSLFRPSISRAKSPGRTVVLGPLREGQQFVGKHPKEGMPEVVHGNIVLRAQPVHSSGAAEINTILDLGAHEGW